MNCDIKINIDLSIIKASELKPNDILIFKLRDEVSCEVLDELTKVTQEHVKHKNVKIVCIKNGDIEIIKRS